MRQSIKNLKRIFLLTILVRIRDFAFNLFNFVKDANNQKSKIIFFKLIIFKIFNQKDIFIIFSSTKTFVRLFTVVDFADELEEISLSEFLKLVVVNSVDDDMGNVTLGRNEAVGQHAVLVQQLVALLSLETFVSLLPSFL